MRKRWIGTVMALVLAATLCGCKKSKEELPPDTPWNNGYNAVMETENGYYTNLPGLQCLRFYEKGTGTEIFLCGKPECMHDGGDSCTATYKNLTTLNSLLYDGEIYVLAVEEEKSVVSYALYRVSPDGSSLDKVAEVFSAENSSDAEVYYTPQTYLYDGWYSTFIIHKGYAYVPFFLSFNYSLKGFVNGGIMKVDIQTGRTEQIYEMETLTSPYPAGLKGCGDYVYFDLHKSSYGKGTGTFRYDTRDGSISSPFPFAEEGIVYADAVTQEEVYVIGISYEEDGTYYYVIETYDVETGEYKRTVSLEGIGPSFSLLSVYDGMLFVSEPDRLILYDTEGKRLGEIGFSFPGNDRLYIREGSGGEKELNFKICADKLYAVCQTASDEDIDELWRVYSCPIADLKEGKGSWSYEYRVESWWALRDAAFDFPRWFFSLLNI